VLAVKACASSRDTFDLETQEQLVKYVTFIQNLRRFSFAYSYDLLNTFINSEAWGSAGLFSCNPRRG